ncbi:hypothetical protein UJ101_01808 [Flavobacteriaceae bacterium UJ101]|nr:hypothetical protein UJ101_01808 [Flavobacteriaceae bacterium UJ101]
MKKIILWGLIASFFIMKAQDTNQQSWVFINSNFKFSDKTTVGIQAWDRHWYGKDYQRDMFFLNPVVKYKSGKKTILQTGIFNIFDVKNNAEGVPVSKTKDHFEFRPWQGVFLDHFKIGKTKVSTLTRLEERFIFTEDYDFDLRFRERVILKRPFGPKFFAQGFSEIIVNVDDDATGLFLNPYELRNHIGLGTKLNPKTTVELGYEFYYNRKNYGGGIDDGFDLGFSTNVYTLTVNMNNIIKKKSTKH